MLNDVKKLLFISRPISWVNTAYPFAVAYLMSGGMLHPFFFIASFYFLIPYNLLMYGINDVFDYESDIRNPRKGGIEGMREQKAFHPKIIIASTITTIPFAIFMILHGPILATIVFILLLFFVIAYSLKWLRFKERPIIDSITSSIHFTGPALYGLVLFGFDQKAWPFIIALFVWGMASHALGAIQDIIPDRKAKIASIATVFGARITIWFVAMLYLIASIMIILQGFPATIIGIAGLVYVLNIAPYLNISDRESSSVNRAWRRFIWLNMFTGFITTMVLLYIFAT